MPLEALKRIKMSKTKKVKSIKKTNQTAWYSTGKIKAQQNNTTMPISK
jgi:hypothetical protein